MVKLARGKDRRHAAENLAIDDLRLRHVGDFGGTAEIRGRREKRILHDRAQQRAGRERFRRGLNRGGELVTRELGIAGKEFSVAAAKRLAAASQLCKRAAWFRA